MAETLAEALTQVIVLHKLPQRIALADRERQALCSRPLPSTSSCKGSWGYPARAECRQKSPPSPDTGWRPPPRRDTPRGGSAARRTEYAARCVVMPPRSLRRDVHPRLEAAIRVHVRRQQRHRGRHQIDHPGQRAFEQRRVFPTSTFSLYCSAC